MKELPILFSAQMVRAVLEERKTQTRRVVKSQTKIASVGSGEDWDRFKANPQMANPSIVLIDESGRPFSIPCPYGKPGDRLWVREAWAHHPDFPESTHRAVFRAEPGVEYDVPRWRPSIHMPRWASRILLEVTSVRVERLNNISEADAILEGTDHNGECDHIRHTCKEIGCWGPNSYRGGYAELWERIYGLGSWNLNPWVWVVSFKRIES